MSSQDVECANDRLQLLGHVSGTTKLAENVVESAQGSRVFPRTRFCLEDGAVRETSQQRAPGLDGEPERLLVGDERAAGFAAHAHERVGP